MARPEPFQSIDDGIIAALAAQDVTCIPYEPQTSLPVPLPRAARVAEDGEPGFRGAQQGFTIGHVVYAIRYYTTFVGDPDLCWQDAYDGLAKILVALSRDHTTLGGNVASNIPTRWSIQAVKTRDNDKPELMVEVFTAIKTKAH